MKSLHEGQLVTVAEGDARLDGIVFQVDSFLKAVVVVADGEGDASFRTVHRNALAERTQPGTNDEVLRKLIRRTPQGARGGRSGGGPVGGARGHTRGADHRSTG
jgi:hypothetical protein